MGNKHSAMRLVLLLVALAIVAESAPINGHNNELLENIDQAASEQAQQEDDKAATASQQVEKDTAQLKSNQNFAAEMGDEIAEDSKMLDQMRSEEQQSIEDAKEIKNDAQTADPDNMANTDQDMEHLNADAEDMSQKIQSTAESLDSKLLSAEKKMSNAGVDERLGEAQDPNWNPETQRPNDEGSMFQTMLQQTEKEAEETVKRHKAARQAIEQKKTAMTVQLDQLRDMAHEGLDKLKASEQKLATDMNGHTDQQLESDIESKAEDLEKLGAVKLGESMTSKKARLEADGLSGKLLGESMSAKKERGGTMTPLEEAEAEAEQAAEQTADSEQIAVPPEAGGNDDAETFDDTIRTQAVDNEPDNYEPNDQQAVDDGGVAADLSAIESDARQLGAYQKTSIEEIKQIQDPLK